jgi:hypothetical protein
MIKVPKGEQKIIYKKQGNIFGCYHIKVLGQDRRHITAIDLDDKKKEKTFNLTRVVEVLDKLASKELAQEKLNQHKENYKNRKLESSFTHGGFFSKAKGHVTPDGELVLDLRGSKETLERDIKVFKLLIYYLNTRDAITMGKCKKFVKEVAPILLNYDPIHLDDYAFSADGKKDLINGYKEEINDTKEYLKELIQTCKDEGIDPNEDDEVQDLIKQIESDSNYLKIVRSDYRQELVGFLCGEYFRKYDDSVFYDITRDFPIDFDKSP